MYKASLSFIFILVSNALTKEPELPLCPPHVQYFPQNLPMHCRMPTNSDFNFPTLPPNFPSAKLPESMPLPGLPSAPSGPIPFPMPMPIQMPPMPPMHPMPAPGPKLPVVVMPIYSQDRTYKQKRVKKHKQPRPIPEDSDTDTSTDDSSDTSSDDNGWWRRSNKVKNARRHRHQKRNNHRRQPLITPVLQYITKDGYVIYEKQISKGEATDWLHIQRDGQNEPKHPLEEPNQESVVAMNEANNNAIKIDKLKQEKNARRHQKKLLKTVRKTDS